MITPSFDYGPQNKTHVPPQTYFCQSCGEAFKTDHSWVFWQDLRFHSQQCKDSFTAKNLDIFQKDNELRSETVKIAADKNWWVNRCRETKIKPQEDFDQYIFHELPFRCPSCGRVIARTKLKCPFCFHFTRSFYNPGCAFTERNQEIVKLLDKGTFTLQEVGNKYDVSRERVRQIYFSSTGKKYTLRVERLNQKRYSRKEVESQRVKFNCRACSTPVTHAAAGKKHSYCPKCHDILFNQKRDPKTELICQGCRVFFHPFRNWKSVKHKPKFCSQRCYTRSMRPKEILDINRLWALREQRRRGLDALYFKLGISRAC